MAWTRSRRVTPCCIVPEKRTRTDSGMSSGMTPVAAAKATRPEPAGKETPRGKRVCESPPVPTWSGSSILLSQEWMMPSPGLRATPPRSAMNLGSVLCVSRSTGLGYAAVWQNDCIVRSAEKPKQARSFSSSRVIGPVVSWEPTAPICGSQYSPGTTPALPQALPTSFCASVKPFTLTSGAGMVLKVSDGGSLRDSRALPVSPLPMMRGMRPPARTSSCSTSDLSSTLDSTSSVPCFFATPS
mmetsp:Transcript_34311/g.98061  ORF Transcript_34311/g.98061 Transcript_34311/m.98061 type:complete len:242 (-) Transcript_34311:316-1041(-)